MFKKMLFTLTSAALLTTSAFAKDVTIPTALGDVAVAENPAKLAVYDPGAIDSLQALGVKMDGVPDIAVIKYLEPTAKTAVDIGKLKEPNYEALSALQPNLIIAGTRTSKLVPELNKIAPTIDMTAQGDKLIENGVKNIVSYGKIFGKEAKAAELKAEIEALFAQTKAAAKDKGNGLIILVNGGKVSAFGSGYRLSWIHNDLGVPMADPNIKSEGHGQPISFEFIQKLNPDWLFVLDRIAAIGEEGKTAQEVLDNDLVRQTKAWKNGNVVYLSSASYLAPGGYEQMKLDLQAVKAGFEKK